ncbi:uncharacterized protein LOC135075933 [Ostrinia nubilalis]|uniref:uncharacterized protein LOC135075933 n=1 Tax=Ostrinia nubilalis TaxID=29057 RepID=UPI0030826156
MDRFFERKLARGLPDIFRQRIPEPYGLETEGVGEKTSSVKRGGKDRLIRRTELTFTIEYEEGMQPSGLSYLTADQPTREIPPGYYDTGDGFYDPKTKVVYKATDLSAIIRSPSIREQKWIIENCRTAPEKELGPRQDLYEEWLEPQVEPQPPPAPSVVTRMPVTVRASRGRFESEVELTFRLLQEDSTDSSTQSQASIS